MIKTEGRESWTLPVSVGKEELEVKFEGVKGKESKMGENFGLLEILQGEGAEEKLVKRFLVVSDLQEGEWVKIVFDKNKDMFVKGVPSTRDPSEWQKKNQESAEQQQAPEKVEQPAI